MDIRLVDDTHIAVQGQTYDCSDLDQAGADFGFEQECDALILSSGLRGGACMQRYLELALTRTISVAVPPASEVQPGYCAINVTIVRDGSAEVDGMPLRVEDLAAFAERRCPDPENRRANVGIDATAPEDAAIRWLDALRAAGITRFVLGVRPRTNR